MKNKYIIIEDDVTVDILTFASKAELNAYLKKHPSYTAVNMSDLEIDMLDD